MKKIITLLLLLGPSFIYAQNDTAVHATRMAHAAWEQNSISATISIGFVDYYRNYYNVPQAFEKGNPTGFNTLYGKVEYGLSKKLGLSANFAYDAFQYNLSHVYTTFNGTITRPVAANTRVFGAGLAAWYHFGNHSTGKRFDPFVGVGLSLNNIRYGAYPEGDSTLIRQEHVIAPVVKAGVRYFISDAFSLYADAGFDKQTICSIGFSCRFFRKPQNQTIH
jgi:outer membrane protein W